MFNLEKVMKTVLNKNKVDNLSQPIFLGEPLGIQRYDIYKYHQFFELFRKQVGFFWTPEEISLQKDRADYATLTDNEKFIFTTNLKFQTMLDSVVSRGASLFLNYITNNELEACVNTWQFFETIHSYAYTYIIKNVYHNPEEIFDSILTDEEILKRAYSVGNAYDSLIEETEDIKDKIYLSLISVNILEAIRFYVSFACTFAFAENKKMIGNADIVKLISRDELVHLLITQGVMKILRDNKDEGFQEVIERNKDKAIQMFLDAVEEEKQWAKYLFKDGSMLGLNADILSKYVEFLADGRMETLGLPKQFGTKNPISWINPWLNSTLVQVAPQESEILSYKKNSIDKNLEGFSFEL